MKFDPDTMNKAMKMWQILSKEVLKIRFIKKDGSPRVMFCTLNFDKIPEEHRPKKVSVAGILKMMQRNKVIRVYDIENYGWRSISLNKINSVETVKKEK